MSFPAYPAYHDSRVEWIGQIPQDWAVRPLKRLACLQTERASGRSFAVALENIEGWSGRFSEGDETYEGEGTAFEVGDILFGKLRPYLAKAWLADRSGEAVGDFHVLRCIGHHRPEFVQRVLLTREIISLIDGSTYGAKMPRASWDFMGSLLVPVPPPNAQPAIAAFLDHETAKIDALVAEQERLIALLKEKRQAVISHAVTKGLDPNAPMKDSGVEWLGQVPAHWEVLPLRRIIADGRRITYGIVQPGESVDAGRFMVRGQDYSEGWAAPDSIFRVAEHIEEPYKRARLVADDIVMTIVGAGVGNIAIVPNWLDGANITQTTARIAVNPAIAEANYVAAVLSGPIGRRSVDLYAKGAAQPGLNLEHVKLFPITIPPVDEQRAILAAIRRLRAPPLCV